MRFFYIPLIISGLFFVSCTTKKRQKDNCMGKPQPDRMCTMQYDPVCGCNGKTYSNGCVATAAGVLHYTAGKCPE